ncbi:hypothetical protein CERZMDRAFT_90225 [Cercospora zeae-maydis SCOH1-5]|uniref:Uncharacterized protein n=1 Tax=Cercospora zeae-maydis SCOH1-5 TaxID=717836 RepID=A0A6A6FN81_9PEZI|nr:hypothetical protein CERZMDRAFT_90225 [Cercospora zeae-maydis SCOH1-5]
MSDTCTTKRHGEARYPELRSPAPASSKRSCETSLMEASRTSRVCNSEAFQDRCQATAPSNKIVTWNGITEAPGMSHLQSWWGHQKHSDAQHQV